MFKYLFAFCILFITTRSSAQSAVDTAKGISPVKSFSYEQYKAYLNGIDINNITLLARINHYPEPDKVLMLKKEIGLNADQEIKITAVNNELKRKAKDMGAAIIKNEIALDNLFKSKKFDDGSLIYYAQRTDLLKGEWRNAALQACVRVRAILTPAQLKKYEQLQKA